MNRILVHRVDIPPSRLSIRLTWVRLAQASNCGAFTIKPHHTKRAPDDNLECNFAISPRASLPRRRGIQKLRENIPTNLLEDEELVGFEFPRLLPPEFFRVHYTPLQLPRHDLPDASVVNGTVTTFSEAALYYREGEHRCDKH